MRKKLILLFFIINHQELIAIAIENDYIEQCKLDAVAIQMLRHMKENNDSIDDKIDELIGQWCGLRYVFSKINDFVKKPKTS